MSAEKENAKLVVFYSTHLVYQSLMKVFSSISKMGKFELNTINYDYTKSIPLMKSSTNYFHYTRQNFQRGNLYLLFCPLLSMGTWEARLMGIPFVGISEYMGGGGHKDALARAVLSNFKGIPFIAHTKRTKKFLESCGLKSVFLIPPAEKKRQGNKERKHILFVGRLVGSKNTSLLLKIAKHFRDEKFIIVGNGPLLHKITEEAKTIGNVEVIPSVESREEIFKYYSGSKLLIHPALKDPVGFVVIEALSTQTPVLASSGVGASDYLPRNWVADPKNEEEWVRKVRNIIDKQGESIKEAEQVFADEHLSLDDPFFEKSAEAIHQSICSRWLHLCKIKKDR